MSITRKATNLLLEAVNEGVLNPEHVLQNLLGWLSEAQVAEFVSDEYSELDPDEAEDEDTDDDTDTDTDTEED